MQRVRVGGRFEDGGGAQKLIRYFGPEPGGDSIKRVLLIASAPPEHIRGIYDSLVGRFPDSVVYDALVPFEARDVLSTNGSIAVYGDGQGTANRMRGRVRGLRFSRSQRYDIVVVMATGVAQYNRFKHLAFISKARKILAYNENRDSFFVDWSHRKVLVSHLKWRRQSPVGGHRLGAISGPARILNYAYSGLALIVLGAAHVREIRRLMQYVR